jgi:hypothetical protein
LSGEGIILILSLELGGRSYYRRPLNTRGVPSCDREAEKHGEMQEVWIFRYLAYRRAIWILRVDHETSTTQAVPMPGMHLDFLSPRPTLERRRDPASQWRSCTRFGREFPATCVRVTFRSRKSFPAFSLMAVSPCFLARLPPALIIAPPVRLSISIGWATGLLRSVPFRGRLALAGRALLVRNCFNFISSPGG